jgi:hypothetical protein
MGPLQCQLWERMAGAQPGLRNSARLPGGAMGMHKPHERDRVQALRVR